jgi:hypothetical protein
MPAVLAILASTTLIAAAIIVPNFKKVPRKTRPAGIVLGLAGIEITASISTQRDVSVIGTVLFTYGLVLGRQAWEEWQQQAVIDRGNAAVARMSKSQG